MPDQQKIAEAMLRSLITKRDNKRAEMEALSLPVIDRVPGLDYRKFQVEVEYWQLKNVVDDLLANYPELMTSTAGDAVKTTPEAGAAAATPTLIPAT